MDSSSNTVRSVKSKLASVFTKVFHIHSLARTTQKPKSKSAEKGKDDGRVCDSESLFFKIEEDKVDEQKKRASMEALIAKLFASLSTVKAAYAHLQISQSPYDADGIQTSDEQLVAELKRLSELKQCFLKKQIDWFPPETMFAEAELQELKSRVRIFELTSKKMESQVKLKGSEMMFLEERLREFTSENRAMERKMNSSGALPMNPSHPSALALNHFSGILSYASRSVRRFTRIMVREMSSVGWDLDCAAAAAAGSSPLNPDRRAVAFESFVWREMFSDFSEAVKAGGRPFAEFVCLRSESAMEAVANRSCRFSEFCRSKYIQVVHPRMEVSFFGNTNQREKLVSGRFPGTVFFCTFAEMARRVWLLHLLGMCFSSQGVGIFQARDGCRFSEVYMETVGDDGLLMMPQLEHAVAFTVVPGFRIGKTVVQCRVCLSPSHTVL